MLIDGNRIAQKIINSLPKSDQPLKLAIFLVGNNKASVKYVLKKIELAKILGVSCDFQQFSQEVTNQQLIKAIRRYTKTKKPNGLILQLPLPKHLNTQRVVNRIPVDLDIDCLTKSRQSDLIFKPMPELVPPAVSAILAIIKEHKIDLAKMKIVVVGYGRLVGKPLIHTLLKKGLSITICQENCFNLADKTRQADLLISVAGQPNLITADMIKDGAIVIDGGSTEDKGEVKGDVDFEVVKTKTKLITPPVGGLGPITVACLFRNLFLLEARKKRQE